ncbi:patatin-like phospholipase family protein [Flavimarina sp. Hel_I_48]|uniref:patatin-like phospholipase family protein n=1 Tax=Flavimarina sp. Hel_I_48 TaxID=1392488 RepID=UPI0004DF79F9|nr:patatin-like phospholipase family protein [Flavimarina sp. Hel_I_48]
MKQFAILVICLLSWSLRAQEDEPVLSRGKDVKVGLVLSGGGAKGLAHIGVLKEIEKAGIKIDYIGGTSMGAIVGALYASGYNANQLDSLFTAVNFSQLIQDALPRSSRSFYEREDIEKYAVTLPFNNFKITLPSAISKGQNIYNLFTQLTANVQNVNDFSKLPIPFFCIATDAEKGVEVILDSGYLPEAVTASGALPSLFSPVLLDGKVLIDGGVINNYPVEELKRRGANFIIGVDVQDDLRTREELKSAPEMLIQINNYRTIVAMEDKIKETDIYIKPDIEEFSVVDFGKGQKIINAGETMAKNFSDDFAEVATYQKERYKKPPLVQNLSDSLTIRSVEIKGNKYYTRSYILGKLRMRLPADLTYAEFFSGIDNLASTGNFQRVNHKFESYENGDFNLVMNLEESEITTLLRASVHYDDLYKSSALGNITKKRLLFKNDVASLDLVVGDNLRYELNYYSDNGFYIGFGFKSAFTGFSNRVSARFVEDIAEVPLENFNSLTLEFADFTNQVYLQTLFAKQFSLKLGIEQKWLQVETENIRQQEVEEQRFYFENSNYISTFGKLRLDTFDNKYFPTSGFYFNGDFHWYLFSSDFNDNFNSFSISKATFKYATHFGSKFSMNVGVEGGFKIAGESINSLDFYLGGWGNDFINNIIPFYGYDFFSLSGDGLVKSSLTLDYEIYPKNHLNIGGNIANLGNKLFSSGNWFSSPDLSGYFVGYGLETFLGPLQTRISYSPETNRAFWNFSLGFWF